MADLEKQKADLLDTLIDRVLEYAQVDGLPTSHRNPEDCPDVDVVVPDAARTTLRAEMLVDIKFWVDEIFRKTEAKDGEHAQDSHEARGDGAEATVASPSVSKPPAKPAFLEECDHPEIERRVTPVYHSLAGRTPIGMEYGPWFCKRCGATLPNRVVKDKVKKEAHVAQKR